MDSEKDYMDTRNSGSSIKSFWGEQRGRDLKGQKKKKNNSRHTAIVDIGVILTHFTLL